MKIVKIHQLHMMMYYEYARASERALYSKKRSLFSWDDYNDRFAEIVSLAAAVVGNSHATHSLLRVDQMQPVFCLDDGVLAPLYEVATLCRDPTIRRRAVDILRSAPRQEGLFNSHLLAMVAEKAIAIEEEAAIAASGSMDYVSIVTDTRPENPDASNAVITESLQIPESVRLVYAFPKFDLAQKRISLTIGPSTTREIDIPWPALDFLVGR